MPITATLGALTYTRLSQVSDYWLLITNDNYPFSSLAIDSNNLIYTANSNYLFQFQDNVTYPKKNWSITIDGSGSGESIQDLKYISYYNKVGFIYNMTYSSTVSPNPTNTESEVYMMDSDGNIPPFTNTIRNRPTDYAQASYKIGSTFAVNSTGQVYHVGNKGGFPTNTVNVMCDLLTGYLAGSSYLYEAGYIVSGSTAANGTGIAINSTNNAIYLGYIQGSSGTTRRVVLTKANTSPTFPPNQLVPVWQRKLTLNAFIQSGRMILDGSNNSYNIVNETNAKNTYLVKYDDNGILQWQRRITGVQLTSLLLNADGFIYATGINSTNQLFITKYSTSGVIQYQMKMAGATFATPVIGIVNNDMYIAGSLNSKGFLIKLPKDASIPGTGSYPIGGSTVLTYSIATQTEAIGNLTDASESLFPPGTPGVASSSSINDNTLTQTNNVFSLI